MQAKPGIRLLKREFFPGKSSLLVHELRREWGNEGLSMSADTITIQLLTNTAKHF